MATSEIATRVPISEEQISEFCQRNHIRKLSLFGSVLRDDFNADSDVDVLVEYEPGVPITLLDVAGQEIELSEILKRKVDVRTAQDLSRYFRQQVVETAHTIFTSGQALFGVI